LIEPVFVKAIYKSGNFQLIVSVIVSEMVEGPIVTFKSSPERAKVVAEGVGVADVNSMIVEHYVTDVVTRFKTSRVV